MLKYICFSQLHSIVSLQLPHDQLVHPSILLLSHIQLRSFHIIADVFITPLSAQPSFVILNFNPISVTLVLKVIQFALYNILILL